MAFKPPKKIPQFADLKNILAQTKQTEDPLYQVVQEIIERLSTLQFDIPTAIISGGGGGGGGGSTIETYLTKLDETATLPNSVQLLARYGLRFDDSLVGKRTIDLDLEYLGSFVAGPLYSDGDIAVGSDGIAYICVKPTNSPPVPWPGIGVTTPAAPLDATYWTVTPNPTLTNERALNLLANGYVKSTAGEPSTIAVIPVSEGGTSATNPANARTNLGIGSMGVQDANNVAITGGTIIAGSITSTGSITAVGPLATNAYLLVQAAAPQILLVDDAINTRWQQIVGSDQQLYFIGYNADGTGGATVARMNRAGDFVVTRDMYASKFVGDGLNLTNLNASALAAGTVPLPRLGTNTPDITKFLRGDNTWATPAGVPSGLIVLSDTPCPVGWTRVNFDGRFLRVNSSAGATGGADTHLHGSGSLAVASHNHGGTVSFSGNTGANGAHSHPFSFHVGGTTGGGSGSVQTADAGGSFTTLTPPHTHSFGADVSANTDGVGDHTHSFNGSGSILAASPGLSGQTDVQSNLPPYIDIILCRKD